MADIKIKIFVSEIANVLSLYDKIQVQRSEAGSPYTDAKDITAVSSTEPELVGTLEGPFAGLQGTTFKIKVDQGSEQSITFTSANPISIENVVDEIDNGITGLTPSSDGGKLKLVGDNAGTDGVLEITGGSSLAILGFTTGQKDNGEDPHVSLLAGVTDYEYDDRSGAASYWYRTRYYNSVSEGFSTWSDWIQGTTGGAISSSDLIVGKIKLADIDGAALVGQKVTIVNIHDPLMVGDYFVAGAAKVIETDGTGMAESTLIKGATVDVIIHGTSQIRRIAVPDTGTEFDMLDASLVLDDPFQITEPDLPSAVRRS
jgi:hypothetical protein